MQASPTLPPEFFTIQSMLTLTGAAGVTFLIGNGLQRAFNFNPRWLGLVIAEVLAVYGTYVSHQPPGPAFRGSDIVVAVVNGFLIFATAAGSSAMGGGPGSGGAVARGAGAVSGGAVQASTATQRRFFSPWF